MKIIISLLILGAIILIHELGHFLLAKMNGITVTEFSIGMGPRLISTEKGGTRYSLKLLPLGGSCLMLGEDGEITTEGSFNSKSVGARMSVILAGPIFNFLLAFLGAVVLIGTLGVDLPYIREVAPDSPAFEAGLQEGDVITAVNGEKVSLSREVYMQLGKNPKELALVVKRDGQKKTLRFAPQEKMRYLLGYNYSPQSEKPEIIGLSKGLGMEQSGAKVGDVITGVNGTPINTTKELERYWEEHPVVDETPVLIQYERDGLDYEAKVVPTASKEWTLGFSYNGMREKTSASSVVKYSFHEIGYQIESVLESLKMLFGGKLGIKDMAGPVGVVEIIGSSYESAKTQGTVITVMTLLNLMILLSANLGVMNLLPLPALDGGRFVFLLIELIRGKPINRDAEGMIHFAGLVLLMILMAVIMFNDVRRIF